MTNLVQYQVSRVATREDEAAIRKYFNVSTKGNFSQDPPEGEEVFRLYYAFVVRPIIRSMEWTYEDTQFALFCASLYLKLAQESLQLRRRNGSETRGLETVIMNFSEARMNYIRAENIADQKVKEVDLLLKLFDIPGGGHKRSGLIAKLKTNRQGVWNSLGYSGD